VRIFGIKGSVMQRDWPGDQELDNAIKLVVEQVCDGEPLTTFLDTARAVLRVIPEEHHQWAEDALTRAATHLITEVADVALVYAAVTDRLRARQIRRLMTQEVPAGTH
jgi:hypothetical protein